MLPSILLNILRNVTEYILLYFFIPGMVTEYILLYFIPGMVTEYIPLYFIPGMVTEYSSLFILEWLPSILFF